MKKMPYLGTSHFGAMAVQYPRKKALKTLPGKLKKVGTAILYGTFGEFNFSFAKMFIEKFENTPHCLEWHLCFRNPHNGLADAASKITKVMEDIMVENTKILICPILEDVLWNDEWFYHAKKVRKKTPFQLVRSPLKNHVRGGRYLEKHGRTPYFWKLPSKCISNMDGLSTDFRDGQQYFKTITQAETLRYLLEAKRRFMALTWYAPGSNGLGGCQGWSCSAVMPPKQRDFVWTKKAIRGTRKLLLSAQRKY